MAEEEGKLRVVFSSRSQSRLIDIWEWTGDNFGIDRARRYRKFLLDWVDRLSENANIGRKLDGSDLRFVVARLSGSANGHVIAYRVRGEVLEIVDFYHTATDWRTYLGDGA